MVQAAINEGFEDIVDPALDGDSHEQVDNEHSEVTFSNENEGQGGEEEKTQEAKPRRGRPPGTARAAQPVDKAQENKVVKLLDKNPLGMTLPEMAGGPRQLKRIRTLRPVLAEAIRSGLVMPVSQRAGHTVYRLVKHMGHR